VGFVQRKMAASMALTHTFALSPDLLFIHIQEKGGPLFIDASHIIGGDFRDVKVLTASAMKSFNMLGLKVFSYFVRLVQRLSVTVFTGMVMVTSYYTG
jgi:hypothetical protein